MLKKLVELDEKKDIERISYLICDALDWVGLRIAFHCVWPMGDHVC